MQKEGLTAGDIAAIGITNQRETTLLWDRKTGAPVHNAIVWQDRRTAEFCDELKAAGYAELIRDRSGLVIDAYFSGSKVRWLLDHVPGTRERAEHGELAFGTIDSWLIWQLTKGALHVTDVTNASRTMLYNLRTGTWDDDLLALLKIPREVLPEVRSSSEVYAETAASLFERPIKIAGIAGDQQAALFGQNCFERGLAKNTYGTGCFMLMNIGEEPATSRHQLLTTVAWRQGGHTEFALEGSVFIGGAVVQWLRDGLGIINSAGEIEKLAASVPDCGGVYLVPAFAGPGRAALGSICARHDHRTDPRDNLRAFGASGARRDRLSSGRRARGDERGFWAASRRVARRRRREREQLADAIPGGYSASASR